MGRRVPDKIDAIGNTVIDSAPNRYYLIYTVETVSTAI